MQRLKYDVMIIPTIHTMGAMLVIRESEGHGEYMLK